MLTLNRNKIILPGNKLLTCVLASFGLLACTCLGFASDVELGQTGEQENFRLFMNGPDPVHSPEMKALIQKAEASDPQALYELGLAYKEARYGVQQSFRRAAPWFKAAADANHAGAQFELARSYMSGAGVQQSYKKAVIYFRLSAAQGHKNGISGLKYLKVFLESESSLKAIYRRELEKAKEELSESQFNVAEICEYGLGTKSDSKRALKWYLRAANNGSADAQNVLGEIYSRGKQEQEIGEEAFNWIAKAAENGQREAQFKLGQMYLNGDNTPKDLKQSFRWFLASAQAGHAAAQHQAGLMYAAGQGTSIDYEAAVGLLEKSVAQGFSPARKSLTDLNTRLDDIYLKNLEKSGSY